MGEAAGEEDAGEEVTEGEDRVEWGELRSGGEKCGGARESGTGAEETAEELLKGKGWRSVFEPTKPASPGGHQPCAGGQQDPDSALGSHPGPWQSCTASRGTRGYHPR